MAADRKGKILNYEAANAFIESVEDPIARRILKLFNFYILPYYVAPPVDQSEPSSDLEPESDFDLLFLYQLLAKCFRRKEDFAALLRGEQLPEWWEEAADARAPTPPKPDAINDEPVVRKFTMPNPESAE